MRSDQVLISDSPGADFGSRSVTPQLTLPVNGHLSGLASPNAHKVTSAVLLEAELGTPTSQSGKNSPTMRMIEADGTPKPLDLRHPRQNVSAMKLAAATRRRTLQRQAMKDEHVVVTVGNSAFVGNAQYSTSCEGTTRQDGTDTVGKTAPGSRKGPNGSRRPPFSTSTSTNDRMNSGIFSLESALASELNAPVPDGDERRHNRRVSMILGLKPPSRHMKKKIAT